MANDARRRQLAKLEHDDVETRRQCMGKTKFPSKKNATARARLIAREQVNDHWMAYKCARCRRWHIGHSNRRQGWLPRPA